MFDFLLSVSFFGCFCFLLSIGYILYIMVLYMVYRLDGGKMGLIKYLKKMA